MSPHRGLALDLDGLDVEAIAVNAPNPHGSLETLGAGHGMAELGGSVTSCAPSCSCCVSCCCCCC
ncbi:hypothetical protein AB0395_12220 [Streptosporangium sp. NPDC051023]|uniref:hypothetical protein n=1 Tax=Streptosporangium sp. NPDC051023 TaxID=3155410 RepID=UPI003450D810